MSYIYHPARLAVSIVLFEPDEVRLRHTLATLAQAVAAARISGQLGEVSLVLTDHSRQRASEARQKSWHEHCSDISFDYCHDPANPGFGAGHNAAYRRLAPADFFLVANPDLEFALDSLQAGLNFLAANPATGVIAPALIEENGVRPACFRSPDFLTLLWRALGRTARTSRRIARYECRDWETTTPVFNPPLMSGCCLLFRFAAYARLAGFDPGYFLYFEDFDLSRRAARLGLSAWCPAMRVRHAGGGASRKGWRHRFWYVRSALRYHLST